MRLRVVCGLLVTMASFSPTRAFSSVDLPALGRPRMQTYPERRAMRFRCAEKLYQLHLARLDGADAEALDETVGGIENFEAQAVVFDDFAFLRDPARELADQTRDRR